MRCVYIQAALTITLGKNEDSFLIVLRLTDRLEFGMMKQGKQARLYSKECSREPHGFTCLLEVPSSAKIVGASFL